MIPDSYADTISHARGSPRSYEHGNPLVLTSAEQFSVVRAIRICSEIKTLAEYSAWLSEDLDSLLHHRGWVCGLGCLHAEGYAATHWFASRDQDEYFSISQAKSKTVISPLLTNWLKSRRPQIYVRASDHTSASAGGNIFSPDQLDNAVLHCQLDPDNKWTSVFSFANITDGPGFRQRLLLDLLVPHLHATLCRVVAEDPTDCDQSASPIKLTARELQILRHIQLGRTNAEIAEHTHKSVFTVNNQVVKVLAKLGARNRTQAVFVAKEIGLFRL